MAMSPEEKLVRSRARGKAYRQRHHEREKARCRAWRAKNPEKAQAKDRAWLEANVERKRATEKAWRESHPEKKLAAVNAWREKNRDRARAVLDAWRKANPDKVRAAALRARAKAKADPTKRMRNSLKAQLNAILKGRASRTATVATFGYTMEQLVAHLEERFTNGMTWSGYGPKGWHVDHIRPVASFALVREDGAIDGDQVRACYALENLRPLPAADNLRKGARLDTPAATVRICAVGMASD